ncbi:CRISPR-associated helicase Cas3' [Actinoplanes sp. TBRC 11911]|nr:CRISPR-associated helicase Cas3' [Actinoplanes sp. TBRC 11911]
MAQSFAEPFGLGDLAEWTGLAHDGGKAWCDWQQKLLLVEPTGGRVGLDHKSFGVQLARRHGLEPAEWVIAGHHGGLSCQSELDRLFGDDEDAEDRLRCGPWADAERRLRPLVPELFSGLPSLPLEFADGADAMTADFLIRFLFSCLVDADVLDTQAHRDATAARVGAGLDAPLLLDRFLTRRDVFLSERPKKGPMDGRRARLFDAAMDAADSGSSIFRLTAPTGTAKTIAAAGFALRHAATRGLRRVIVAVPFITITEQNAAVYRRLLDPEDRAAQPVVLEQHSQVEFESGSAARHALWWRAAAENWDAPFVVTTTVQLFESLFGRTASRMRKLHRLANSVIVLDEVQALPHRLLPQVADAIRVLSQRFGVTFVLSSATQPELQQFGPFAKLPAPREIMPNAAAFFSECRRVEFRWWPGRRPTLEQVVTAAAANRQALMVVNTVKDARSAFLLARSVVGHEVLHLSTGMCPAHRQRVLERVKDLLDNEKPLLLVSTSLVEAGVDLDFPVAFRAVAPPDSIAQVAGRCNREGQLGDLGGLVVIFDPVDGGMPPSYRTQIDKAAVYFGPDKADPDNVEALAAYYRDLYRTLGVERRGGASDTIRRNRARRDFKAVADGPLVNDDSNRRDLERAFRMIVEDTVPVVVPYADPAAAATIADCLARLRGSHPDTSALRSLQPYLTTMRRRTAQRPETAPLLREVVGDLRVWEGRYDEGYGLVVEPTGDDFIV